MLPATDHRCLYLDDSNDSATLQSTDRQTYYLYRTADKPTADTQSVIRRSWRRLSHDAFAFDMSASRLCLSYLSGRTQYVRCGSSRSSTTYLVCGVLQGSVLGPVLFVLYTVDLVSLIESRSLSPHLYADDTVRLMQLMHSQ